MKTLTKQAGLLLSGLVSLALIIAEIVSLPAPSASAAGLSVLPMFSNNGVLQRNMPVPVFGTANAGATVNVSFNGQNVSTTAAGDGTWRVNLASMAANSSPNTMTISSAGQTLNFTGLQVGEVWVCSGQSNMLFELNNSTDGPAAAADAPNHNIRLIEIDSQGGVAGSAPWAVSNATTAGAFSAICYWFGLELSNSLNVPIGLIQSSKGGTDIIEWTHANGGSRDGQLYDSMVKPLQPYAIRGANWYQGENDAFFGPAGYYNKLVGLINEWRTDWGQGSFPFQIAQLHWKGADAGWASVRQDELQAHLDVANTTLAVNVDAPEGGGHPPVKRPIGIRFGIAARGFVYGENIEYMGPIPSASLSSVQGNQFIIGFTHLGGGLVTGSEFQPTGAPVPFALAGTDGIFYPATGQIVGNTVVVTSASVPNPVSVEYVWDLSQGNLYNNVSVPSFYGTVTRLPVPSFKLTLSGGGPTPTPTRTNTPAPPTATNTPGGPTNTPTPTPTRTNTPTPTATSGGSTVMHIADVLTTDVNGNPLSTFSRGDTVYYRVKIVDQGNAAVSGASVTVELRRPDNSLWNTKTATTDATGWALFNQKTVNSNPAGTYTAVVTGVTKSGATYDPAANVKSSTTFVLQ